MWAQKRAIVVAGRPLIKLGSVGLRPIEPSRRRRVRLSKDNTTHILPVDLQAQSDCFARADKCVQVDHSSISSIMIGRQTMRMSRPWPISPRFPWLNRRMQDQGIPMYFWAFRTGRRQRRNGRKRAKPPLILLCRTTNILASKNNLHLRNRCIPQSSCPSFPPETQLFNPILTCSM